MDTRKQIKLADVECTDNRAMNGIEELAANIAAVGLLQPVILTPAAENGKYRVVDGRRRFRALEHLKREALEFDQYVIWTGNQYQEREAAFCANFARQNLTLAEEVEALRNIYDTNEGVAKLLGKTPAWVALRRNLANLTDKWREVLNHPEEYPQWTAAKLELIARETPETQNEFAEDWIDSDFTIAELKEEFADAHRLISAFPFGTAECMECAKRSGAQGLLFSDYDPKKDCCLDMQCFVRKAVAFARQRLAEPGIAYTVRGSNGCFSDEDSALAEEFPNNYPYQYKEVRKPRKGEKPNAVVVCGEEIGEYRVVVPREGQFDNKNDTGAKNGANGANGEKREKTVAEREVDLLKKRNKLALQKLKEWLDGDDNTFESWKARSDKDRKQGHEICLKLAMWYGIDTSHGAWGDYWYRPIWQDVKEFEAVVFKNAKRAWRNILFGELNKTLENISMEAGSGICGLLFLDWDELFMKPAIAQLPEPKALIAARIKEQQAARKAAEKAAEPAKKKGAKK